jgi:hypothetical protein
MRKIIRATAKEKGVEVVMDCGHKKIIVGEETNPLEREISQRAIQGKLTQCRQCPFVVQPEKGEKRA